MPSSSTEVLVSTDQPSGVSAFIDAIADGVATILIEEEGKEIHRPVDELPSGMSAGSWIRLYRDGDQVIRIEPDPETTKAMRARIREKMERLRNKGRSKK